MTITVDKQSARGGSRLEYLSRRQTAIKQRDHSASLPAGLVLLNLARRM
jgi:hypothetical protein